MYRVLIGMLLICGCASFLLRDPAPTLNPDFRMGVHLLMDSGGTIPFPDNWHEHLRYAHLMTGEGGWVVQVVQSNDLNVAKWQQFIDDCARLGLRPVLRLATYPSDGHWAAPPMDQDGGYATIAQQWQDFFARLQLEQPVWVVVGNEVNNGAEWGGRAEPRAYLRYFLAITTRLRQLDQPLYVAMAALDLYTPHTNGQPFPGTDITMIDAAAFLDEIFAAQPDILSHVDFWAGHVYPLGAFYRPPWEREYRIDRMNGAEFLPLIDPPAGLYNRGVNGYQWERWYVTVVHGQAMPPILITEMGYRHRESMYIGGYDAPNALVDGMTAAQYLELTLFGNQGRYPDLPETGWQPLATDPDVLGVVYFGLAGRPEFWGHSNLLQVNERGAVIGTTPLYDVLVKHAR